MISAMVFALHLREAGDIDETAYQYMMAVLEQADGAVNGEPDAHNRDLFMQMVQAQIDKHGWIVQGVGASNVWPAYHYTVGLYPMAGFEIVAMGLPVNAGAGILNALGRMVREGHRFTDGELIDNVVAQFPVAMKTIPVTGKYLGVANRLYAPDGWAPFTVPAWQMVWCDVERRFPWDPGYSLHNQVLLWEFEEDPDPEELERFQAFLDQVEAELAGISENEHRRSIAKILREAGWTVQAQRIEAAITDD